MKNMNYFVVSPNVYNDGNIDFYLKEMHERQIVIMGYSKEDGNKWVKMFDSTMKIGDCVIVARGANWQKQVFFAGIVSSNAMPYTDDGESLFREIQYLTDLNSEEIPFNINCAFGASKQSGSIYQLKPDANPADKSVTDAVSALITKTVSEHLNKKRSYSLKEISTWPNALVSLPGIQRGLVWKPAQVELLWDSILRGFPIGTFTLSESDTSTSNTSQYYLMDGQQRFNSIALGFSKIQEKSPILWLDINPQIPSSSTRKYMIRLTTMAHPWGYKDDDNCSALSTNEKRTFLNKIGRKSVYKETLNPMECYPYKAHKPVPLSWLLNASTINKEKFYDELNQKLKNTKLPLPYDHFTDEEVDLLKNNYFNLFKTVKQYRVGVSIISSEAIDKATDEEKIDNQPESLEVLFRRIGTGGTQITQEELNYSAIKAYWPQELREENDRVAEKYMNSERLVRLVFRLALTDVNSREFKKDLSIKKIREFAQNKGGDEFKKITEWYSKTENGSRISKVMDTVNSWLTYDNCPKFLRTSIARNSPDVYLLMMFFASQFENEQFTETQILFLQSVAYYLHWLAGNNKGICVNTILKEYQKVVSSNGDYSPFYGISAGIQECVRLNLLPLICSTPDIEEMKCNSQGGLENPDERFGYIWELTSKNREMLLYAQREYLNEKFPNYDPAQRGMWEQHNRPWDLDHIIPQDWVSNKRGDYREYCKKWLWINGNFAAISFESNRSKSNQSDWGEYDNHSKMLLFLDEIKNISPNVTYDKNQANLFGKITFLRTRAIYFRCYEMLSRALYGDKVSPADNPFLLLVPTPGTPFGGSNKGIWSETIASRRELLINIQNILRGRDYKTDIRWTDDKYSRKEFEINVDLRSDDMKWCHAWLTVGFTPDDTHYVCICTKDGQNLEIGIRKHPNESELTGSTILDIDGYETINNDWWYIERDVNLSDMSVDNLCDELLKLNSFITQK